MESYSLMNRLKAMPRLGGSQPGHRCVYGASEPSISRRVTQSTTIPTGLKLPPKRPRCLTGIAHAGRANQRAAVRPARRGAGKPWHAATPDQYQSSGRSWLHLSLVWRWSEDVRAAPSPRIGCQLLRRHGLSLYCSVGPCFMLAITPAIMKLAPDRCRRVARPENACDSPSRWRDHSLHAPDC